MHIRHNADNVGKEMIAKAKREPGYVSKEEARE